MIQWIAELEAFYGKNSPYIKQYPTTAEALTALQNHQVDGVFAGESNLKYAVNAMPTAVKNSIGFIAYPQAEVNHIGYAVQKNRADDLLNKLNIGLNQIKQDGTYQKIYQKWFGN